MIDNLQGTFLSNFFECNVYYNSIPFDNAESALQASKCYYPEDRMILRDLTGATAKRVGKAIKMRKDWHDIRVNVMFEIVTAKFEQNPDLMEMLLATGDEEIVEGNYWNDKFWGKINGGGGEGANHLGLILMRVRSVNTTRKVN